MFPEAQEQTTAPVLSKRTKEVDSYYSLEGYCSIQLSYGQMDVVGCVADPLAECPQLLGAGR